MADDSRSSSSRRRAGAGGSPRARRSSTPRARSASTSTRSAAGAASAAAARSSQALGDVRQARDRRPSRTTCRPSAALEATYRAEKGLAADRRLSCTAQVRGDVVIDVPPESQVHRQVVRKGLDVRDVRRRPGRPAPLRRGRAARARVADRRPRAAVRGARARVGADRPRGRPRGHPRRSSRRSRRATTGSPSRSTTARQVIGVWPGLHERPYGVAIDVGSTTIAGHLADLADGAVLACNGVMNPQIRFGEDLMSRVSYAMIHPSGARRDDRAPCARRSTELVAALAMRAGHRAARDPRAHARRQPDHAPPRARHRPDAARLARRSRWPRTGRSARPRRSSACAPTPAPASTSCPASPATSAPTRPA